MTSSYQSRRVRGAPWRTLLCVLLIGLVLYNPFFGLTPSGNSPSYETLARNRATVGASELQHFSPESSIRQPDMNVEVSFAEPAKTEATYPVEKVQREVHSQRPEFFAGVWFRPPPSR